MKSGFELLIANNAYDLKVIDDFEKVLGILPLQYKSFLMTYKTGYPSLNKIEDTEVYAIVDSKDEMYFIESFNSLPEVMDKQYCLDRAYGL